jgi:maltose alpha-D-glucosyltransferase/alpha-amylase
VIVIEVLHSLFDDVDAMRSLEQELPAAISNRRWFGAKSRSMTSLQVFDALILPAVEDARLLLATIIYDEGASDTYLLPVRLVDSAEDSSSILFEVRFADGRVATLIDGCHDAQTSAALLDAIEGDAELRGTSGTARGMRTDAFEAARGTGLLEPRLWRREGSNSSVVYGDRLMLKVFRRPEIGRNPDWELGRYLTEHARFAQVPVTAGAIEYTDHDGGVRTLGLLQQLVPNDGDARQRFMFGLRDYFAAVDEGQASIDAFSDRRHDANLDRIPAPALAQQLFGAALGQAALLGRRTAEMHLAFAAASAPELAPESFTTAYQDELHASACEQLRHVLELLERSVPILDASSVRHAERLLALGPAVYAPLDAVKDLAMGAQRIRVHGDYHLEQVLVSNGDYVILDFEGEPSASLPERRIKRSPLKDVAGMIRSFDYAARAVLDATAHVDAAKGLAACNYWTSWVGGAFLEGYLGAGGTALMPEGREASEALLRTFLLEKAAYEVIYELNNRPTWVDIPLRGILEQLD